MNSRSMPLVLGLLCGLACDSSSAPADPAKAAAGKAEAKEAKKTDPAPAVEGKKTEPAPKTETKAEPTPATDVPAVKAEPTPVPPAAVPVAQASAAAGVDPPKQSIVLALARAKGFAKAALATKLAEAGARRYVAAIRDRKPMPSGFPEYSLHLLLLRLPEAAAGAKAEWVVDGAVELHRWGPAMPIDDPEGSSSIPTTLVVDDHDRDGEIEVLARYRHEFSCTPMVSMVTDLAIVELEPTLAVALKTELHHELTEVAKKGTAHHEDLDGDGHPDLRVGFSTKAEGEPKPKLTENRWRWVADDTWAPLTDGAKLPTEPLAGCEWREAMGVEIDIDG